MDQRLVANDEDTVGSASQLRMGPFDSLNDHRAGGSTLHLGSRISVKVRVIPIEPGSFFDGGPETVSESGTSRLNTRMENIVLMADWRHSKAVKMEVRG